MKLYTLLAGLSLSLGVATIANAKIVHGTMEGYFTRVYATDLAGVNRLAQFDNACSSKYWFLVNTPFFSDYRVNTDSNLHAAFFTYAKAEHTLTGVVNAMGQYEFKTDKFGQSLKDLHAKALSFTVNSDFWHGGAQLTLEGSETPHAAVNTTVVTTGDCHTDCPHGDDHCVVPVTTYQCVLST